MNRFKQSLVTLAFGLIILLNACKKDSIVSTVKDNESNTVLSYIKSLGFKESQIKDIGNEYLVDGDILFPKSLQVKSKGKSGTRISQYGSGSYVNGDLVLINVDPSMSGFSAEIQSAIDQWNSIPNSRLSFQIYNGIDGIPNLTITSTALGLGVCGAAYTPSNGSPGDVFINTGYIQGNSFAQRQRTITHELGHAIGLLHTNENQGVLIPGTSTNDSNSLMNANQCGSGATTLSYYDKLFVDHIYYKSGASLMPANWELRATLYGTYEPTNFISPSETPLLVSNGTNSIYSPNGLFRLTLEPNGDLVVYDSNSNPKWSNQTPGATNGWIYKLFFQLDGNITLKRCYTNGTIESEIWASASQAPNDVPRHEYAYRSYLKMQDDGNLVLYFNGLDGRQWYYGYSTTSGVQASHHQGDMDEFGHR